MPLNWLLIKPWNLIWWIFCYTKPYFLIMEILFSNPGFILSNTNIKDKSVSLRWFISFYLFPSFYHLSKNYLVVHFLTTLLTFFANVSLLQNYKQKPVLPHPTTNKPECFDERLGDYWPLYFDLGLRTWQFLMI